MRHAVTLALLLSGATALMSFVNARFGHSAAGVTAAISGLFDVHAAAASTLAPDEMVFAILFAFSSNTFSKLVAAFWSGGAIYGLRVAVGLIAVAAAAWAPLLWLSR